MLEDALRDMAKAIGCLMVAVPVLLAVVAVLVVLLVLKW